MKVVYIAHRLSAPTRDGIEANRARASRWVAWAASQGVAPVATWIVLTGQWNESDGNRVLGLKIDCALIGRCDELWVCGGADEPTSEGMRLEVGHASQLPDCSIRYFITENGEPPT